MPAERLDAPQPPPEPDSSAATTPAALFPPHERVIPLTEEPSPTRPYRRPFDVVPDELRAKATELYRWGLSQRASGEQAGGISHTTVGTILREAGIPAHPMGYPELADTDKQRVADLTKKRKSAATIAQRLGIPEGQVKKVRKKISAHRPPGPEFKDLPIKLIKTLYERNNMTFEDVAGVMGASTMAVYKAYVRAGGVPRCPGPNPGSHSSGKTRI